MRMQNRISFGKWEAATLLINLICTKLFLYFARMTVEDAGTAGWIMTIYISILVLILYTILMKLLDKFEGKDLIDISEIAGGKLLRTVTGLVITASLFYLSATVLREFCEDIKVVSLPSSPISYIMMFFTVGIIVGSFLGIEAIIRYHAIIVPVILAGFLIIVLGVIPQMDFTNALPVLGNGTYPILVKGFSRISVFGELMVLFLLPPFIGSSRNVRRVGYIAIGVSSFFLIIGSLAYILTFPYPSNMETFLPVYQLARLINMGRFFERIEAIFVFFWAMAAFIYLTSVFFFMTYAFSKTAGLKYMRPLILPFGIIVFSAAFIPPNLIIVIKMNSQFFSRYAWLVTFVFTGLILLAGFVRKNSQKGRADK